MRKKQILEQVRDIIFKKAKNGFPITENEIAKQLSISRTPVREVLSWLEEEGILERKQRKGIVLRNPTLKELIEIYDLRSALEGLACRLLAQTRDEETLKKLRDICRRMNEARKRKNHNLEFNLDASFHYALFSKCNNERLKRMVNNLHILNRGFRIASKFEAKSLDTRMELKYPHDSIVEALEKKNPERAELIAKLHVQEGKMNIINQFFDSSILPIYPER